VAVSTIEAPRNSPSNGHQPPRLTLAQAVQSHLAVVLLPVVILTGAGVALGLARSPTYRSDAQLNVGGVNLTVQSLPGYSVGVAQLASAYARTIGAAQVAGPAAHAAGVSRADLLDDVSATPVEGTGVIRIHAEAPTAEQAQRMANAVANALVAHAATLNRVNPDKTRLRAAFGADSRALHARESAQLRVDLARLQRQTDGVLYQQSQAGNASTSLVQKLAPATPATSDRTTMLERFVAAGLLAGFIIGVALAVARANALSRRRLAH
jgi:hypothetical protein